ncbi:hypothetical protein AJ80_02717 [Polytolypa hystricis UAMH7299]|uniref:Uncharacterized protein n=1 Tax=Polytolypa hystricis (strain UAMH7299) TaxID=1447883 RepID=A0A2B7YRD9_POLH7|nr:hypothetical protein AJ80_02717 [Polytolypa hystricis UAMH7299]
MQQRSGNNVRTGPQLYIGVQRLDTRDAWQITHLLLTYGATVDARDQKDLTPLFYAALRGNEATTRVLINHGANIHATECFEGNTILHAACASYDVGIVTMLLSLEANANARNDRGWTPIMAATGCGCFEVLQLLILQGADVNAVDKSGSSALGYAIASRGLDIIRLLVNHGADMHNVSNRGTALHEAIWRHSNPHSNHLFGHVAQILLAGGFDINVRDGRGRTALMEATVSNQLEVIDFLLDNNADISAKDDCSNSALHLAAGSGMCTSIEELLARGAEINARNNCERTPLMEATVSSQLEAKDFLLDKNADISSKDNCGNSALHLGAGSGMCTYRGTPYAGASTKYLEDEH